MIKRNSTGYTVFHEPLTKSAIHLFILNTNLGYRELREPIRARENDNIPEATSAIWLVCFRGIRALFGAP